MNILAVLFGALLVFSFYGCGGCLQTRPSCSIEPFATVEFRNYEEVNKLTYIQRFYDDKELGEPIIRVVEAKTTHLYRLPPGYYELGVRKLDGTYQVWQTRDQTGKWSVLAACDNPVVNMRYREVPPPKFKIRPRRQQ